MIYVLKSNTELCKSMEPITYSISLIKAIWNEMLHVSDQIILSEFNLNWNW